MSDINPYAAPEETSTSDYRVADGPPIFFPVGITKLYVMCICTLGLYSIYWFERQFRYYSAHTREGMMPFWRGVFSIFFVHRLFRAQAYEAHERGLSVHFNASQSATTYVVIVIGSRVLQRVLESANADVASLFVSLATLVASVVPLAAAQRVANEVIAHDDREAFMNESFSAANIVVLAVFAVPFAFVLMALTQ